MRKQPKGLTIEQDALFEKYLPYVRHLAAKVASRLPLSVDIEDLVCAGHIGLMQAVQSFDKLAGYPFLSFSRHRIRGAMIDEIRTMDWVGRAYRRKADKPITMVDFTSHNAKHETRKDPVSELPNPENIVATRDLVAWFLNRLSRREAMVVRAYHGEDDLTYKEIAKILKMSEGRVSHLYHQAMSKLQKLAAEINPEEFFD